MPRVTHVKAARQRYETVPVIDPDTGEPKVTTVMRKDGVTPKTTKRGKTVTMRVTVADKTKPLPNLRCDFSGCDIDGGEILPGTPYKHITPRSGPFGGYQRNRHEAHPNWAVWEYSSSVSAQAAQLQAEMHAAIDAFEFDVAEDFDALRDEITEMADGFVQEREEAVSNMPESLQDGSQAQEYQEAAESWKDEIDGAQAPDAPDEQDCEECEGTGKVDVKWYVNGPDAQSLAEDGFDTQEDADAALNGHLEANPSETEDDWTVEQEGDDCETCEGTGKVESEELDEDWVEEAKGILRDAVDASQL